MVFGHQHSSPDISGQWTSREDALYTGHPLILNLRNFSIKSKRPLPSSEEESTNGGLMKIFSCARLNATLLEWKSQSGSDADYNVSAIQRLIL